MIVYMLLHGSVICWTGAYTPDKHNQPFVTDDYEKAQEFKKFMEQTFPEKEVGYEVLAAHVLETLTPLTMGDMFADVEPPVPPQTEGTMVFPNPGGTQDGTTSQD